ncbi:hypothetical protein PG5_22420 [Pseudomonas sp. G5(2012)]|nr:hypothetical protein PG5_22420 [Pseudomonas sp. G5(2012)]
MQLTEHQTLLRDNVRLTIFIFYQCNRRRILHPLSPVRCWS